MATLTEIEQGLSSSDETRRWSAAAAASDLVDTDPWALWPLVLRYGTSECEDLRMAVATCVLEHLLENRFDTFFPLLEERIRAGDVRLADTLRICWKLGQAEQAGNAARWDQLLREISALRRP